MLTLISPAKTLDFSPTQTLGIDTPKFKNDAKLLVQLLKKKSANDLAEMMRISDKLAQINFERFQSFSNNYTQNNSKPAILTFKGEVYLGLDALNLSSSDLEYSQENLRILSGLYGILKPLDKMQAYRLEMGSSLTTERGKTLYAFWGDKLTKEINKQLNKLGQKLLLNLASNEYFNAIQKDKIKGKILDIDFRENRNGKITFVSYTAKKARGLMTRYMIKNRIENFEDLKSFDYEGYYFDQRSSGEYNYTFIKDHIPPKR